MARKGAVPSRSARGRYADALSFSYFDVCYKEFIAELI